MWEPVAFVLFGGAAFGFAIWKSRQRLQSWLGAAAACGLEVVESHALLQPWLAARAGRLEVRIEASGDKGRSTRIMVQIPRPLDFHMVRIRPESLLQWGREIEIGDDSFDKTFFIEGPMRLVLALLDAETRRLLLRLNDEGRPDLSLEGLQVDLTDEKVSSALPLLLSIGERLAQPMDVPERLAENARQDPNDGVRLQNLLFLIRQFPKAPPTAEALRTACSDSSPEIRLHAAKALGTEGQSILLRLAESLEDDTVSAKAVATLDSELPFEIAKSLLDRALALRRIQTAHVCLEVLGRSGAAAAVGVLVKSLEGNLAAVAARALGETGNPAAEPWLIPALQREPKDLRVAAANALGRVGSVAAVLPLKEAAERSWLDLDLRQAARQAVAEIQSRLPGASHGQLSLAGAEAGQLSLVQAEAGQLSIATDPAGQLSISGTGDTLEKV